MTWVKLDDEAPTRLRRAGREAAWLYVCSLTHVSQYLLGDELPDADVPIVAATADLTPPKAVKMFERLVELGFTERRDEGWALIQSPGVGKWSRTQADVEQMKKDKAAAGRASAVARAKRRAEREQREQQRVEQAVEQAVERRVEQAPQQTRDVGLSPTERETYRSPERVPVEIPDFEACANGTKAAKAVLKAVSS